MYEVFLNGRLRVKFGKTFRVSDNGTVTFLVINDFRIYQGTVTVELS